MIHVIDGNEGAAWQHRVCLAHATVGELAVTQRHVVDRRLEQRLRPPLARRDAERPHAVGRVRVGGEEGPAGAVGEVEDLCFF